MMRPRGAGQPAGHITMTVSARAGTVSLAVRDDGVGLPEGDHERLTEPYVTHKPKGTGLGLAIVKKIMEDHGGSLSLEDAPHGMEGEAMGAVATLSLPLLALEPVEA